MRLLLQFFARLRELVSGTRIARELDEELDFHLQRETEANIARGLAPIESRRVARLHFGSVSNVQEHSRDQRTGAWLHQLFRDVGFGVRLMRKSVAFSAASISVIALGIAASTAIFSVVYGVLLKPLPYYEPERLVSISTRLSQLNLARGLVNVADYRDWRVGNSVFTDVAAARNVANLNVVGDGDEPERLQGARLSANLFSVLGVTPLHGRAFTADEQEIGRENVAILSYGLWQRRYAGDSTILGRRIRLNGTPHVVIGVMRADFQYPSRDYQIFVPLTFNPAELSREQPGYSLLVVARLRDGVAVAEAQHDMSAVAHRLESAFPASNKDVGVEVSAMSHALTESVRAPLNVLLGAVIVLLLVACLNFANLLAARAARRRNEFALRLALGASSARLAMQAFAEAAPLLVIGGATGVLVAAAAVRTLVAAAPASLPRVESIQLSAPVLLFAIGAVLVTGVLASLIPAWHALRSDFTATTKEGSRSSAGGARQSAARRVLVIAQVACAVPLLAGAGLLMKSFSRLTEVSPGFRTERVLSLQVAVPRTKYPLDAQVAGFESQLLQSVGSVPGVESVGMVNRLPLGGVGQLGQIEGENSRGTSVPSADWRTVTPGYFATLGIPLIEGRNFSEADDSAHVTVGIVDSVIARQFWPGESAIGKRLRVPLGPKSWVQVVGVVGHIRHEGLDVDPRPQVYWNYRQRAQDRMALVVRTKGKPQLLTSLVVRAIRAVDSEQAVYEIRTMDDVLSRTLADRRLTMRLFFAFGAVALALSAVGVFSVIAFSVTQRTREFGVRLALGAEPLGVVGMIVRQGATLALSGALVGLVAAVAASGVMKSLLYTIRPLDVATLAGATLILLLVALLASLLPATRVMRIDAASALRVE